ncbi:MAG: hypothetical protein LBU32_25745 [Clostridiales bacterium]|jgi:hypothetical protein|nr:hypothetical protein [Clostridiales bacterium]
MKEVSQIWLEDITGPSSLSDKIVQSLLNAESVTFLADPNMPWKLQFRGNIESRLGRVNLRFKLIDDADDVKEGEDIGKYLVTTAAHNRLHDYLRKRSNKERNDFIRENNLFNSMVFWVKGLTLSQAIQWIQFIYAYRSKKIADGMFVLEIPSQYQSGIKLHSSIVKYSDFVKNQDLLLYASILVENSSIPPHMRLYAANVAASICVTDAEVADKMLRDLDFENEDPIAGLKRVHADWFANSSKGKLKNDSEPHPFELLEDADVNRLEKRVWIAQLQIAFPAIELERVEFINNKYILIKEAMNTEYLERETGKTDYIRQYNDWMWDQNPYDVEIGTLWKMIRLYRKDKPSQYLLHVSEEERQRLSFLRDRRNDLAHMKTCTPQQISDLFKKYRCQH